MILRHLTLILFFAFASIALAGKPNIILIVGDDFGNERISYYGANNIQTLHIAKGDARPQYSPCTRPMHGIVNQKNHRNPSARIERIRKKRKQINKGGEKYHG